MWGIVFVLYGAFLFAIQTSLLDWIAVNGVTPDLVLICVVFGALHLPEDRGLWLGFGLGLVQDCLSGGLLGVNTLSKSLIAFFLVQIKGNIRVEGFLPVCLFLLAASFFDGMVYFITVQMLFKTSIAAGYFLGQIAVYSVYNSLMGPPMFILLERNRRWLTQKMQSRTG
ncbi:MAG: rod shape-determining protein MreD [Nitrospinaceae bacterium]